MIFILPFLKKQQLLSVYGLSKRGHIYYLSVHSTESRARELYLAMVPIVTCAKQQQQKISGYVLNRHAIKLTQQSVIIITLIITITLCACV